MNKIIIVLLILFGIIISGCIANPLRQVPVVKVNITFAEDKQGIAQVVNYTLVQGTVNYLSRPRQTEAYSFPAIGSRTIISKSVNSSIGPWEMVPYKGSGTYSYNIGFDEKHYPVANDTVHVSITVVNANAGKIGNLEEIIKWK
ncbi:MAG: hypothetical protein O8C62_10530 [Candidatus Methanoperedens sp.]|nr:hypothetical protein [Candidatus Methanoperedens sp.]